MVRLGTHILSDASTGRVYDIKTIEKHPNYKPPAMYSDIALLELNDSVTFTDLIKPACLYQQFDTTPLQAWVSGWGVTQIGEFSYSFSLRGFQVPKLKNLLLQLLPFETFVQFQAMKEATLYSKRVST